MSDGPIRGLGRRGTSDRSEPEARPEHVEPELRRGGELVVAVHAIYDIIALVLVPSG